MQISEYRHRVPLLCSRRASTFIRACSRFFNQSHFLPITPPLHRRNQRTPVSSSYSIAFDEEIVLEIDEARFNRRSYECMVRHQGRRRGRSDRHKLRCSPRLFSSVHLFLLTPSHLLLSFSLVEWPSLASPVAALRRWKSARPRC